MLRFAIILCLMAGTARAELDDARFNVAVLGVKVAELTLTGETTASAYTTRARLRTTGLAGVLKRVHFHLSARGRMGAAGPVPHSYSEVMNTGHRTSQLRLRYRRGQPGFAEGSPGPMAARLDDQRGTVDPASALYAVLRDRAGAECAQRLDLFDGTRRSLVVLAPVKTRAGRLLCRGRLERIAGYTPEELAQARAFALEVEYAVAHGQMRAMRARVQTLYGPAVLRRR